MKRKINTVSGYYFGWRKYCALIVSICLIGCAPDEDYYIPLDDLKLRYVLQDNNELTTFLAATEMTEMNEAFTSEKSYVVLAPSNAAFLRLGYTPPVMRGSRGSWLSNMVRSHVLEDYLDFDELPFMAKQKLYTQVGNPVYVTRWLHDQDTLVTVNGIRTWPRTFDASNGRVYVLEQVLQDRGYTDVFEAIQNQHAFTLFSYAITRAGMESTLREMKECTVFVPNNAAMAAFGYNNFQAIQAASLDELRHMIFCHLLDGLLFVSDIGLSVDMNITGRFEVDVMMPDGRFTTESLSNARRGETRLEMHNNRSLRVVFSEGYFGANYGYRMHLEDGTARGASVHPLNKDIVADNGVIHTISKVLEF